MRSRPVYCVSDFIIERHRLKTLDHGPAALKSPRNADDNDLHTIIDSPGSNNGPAGPGRCNLNQEWMMPRLFAGPRSYPVPLQGLFYSAGGPTERA